MIGLPEVMLSQVEKKNQPLLGVLNVLQPVSSMRGLWIKGVLELLIKASVEFRKKRAGVEVESRGRGLE